MLRKWWKQKPSPRRLVLRILQYSKAEVSYLLRRGGNTQKALIPRLRYIGFAWDRYRTRTTTTKKPKPFQQAIEAPAAPHLVSIAKDLFYGAGMQGQLKTEGKTLILRYSLWHPRLHSRHMVTAAIHWGLWCTKGNHSNNKTKTHLNSWFTDSTSTLCHSLTHTDGLKEE